jgi:hypothetical protein
MPSIYACPVGEANGSGGGGLIGKHSYFETRISMGTVAFWGHLTPASPLYRPSTCIRLCFLKCNDFYACLNSVASRVSVMKVVIPFDMLVNERMNSVDPLSFLVVQVKECKNIQE